MSWMSVLKVSPRERMDAEDFAPKEMQQFRDEKHRDAQNSIKEELREYLRLFESWVGNPFGGPNEEMGRVVNAKKEMVELTRPLEGFNHEVFMMLTIEQIVNGLREYFDEEEK